MPKFDDQQLKQLKQLLEQERVFVDLKFAEERSYLDKRLKEERKHTDDERVLERQKLRTLVVETAAQGIEAVVSPTLNEMMDTLDTLRTSIQRLEDSVNPLHTEVSTVQRDVRWIREHLESVSRRSDEDATEALTQLGALEQRVATLETAA